MSYEGYEQILCEDGHLYTFDCYNHRPYAATCPCGKPFIWWNSVDCTNEPDEGYVALVEKTPAEYCVCACCNHRHQVKPETYYIPTDQGHQGSPGDDPEYGDNMLTFADQLDTMQAKENNGIQCVRVIVLRLRQGEYEWARSVYRDEGDKTRQYPEIEQALVQFFGCRQHGIRECDNWVCKRMR